jgi:iron complex outermembrane receptor protein
MTLCFSTAVHAQASVHDQVPVAPGTAASQDRVDGVLQLQDVRIEAQAAKDLGFAPVEAETAGKAPMRRLETPQSVSVVTSEQMATRQVNNLQQALQTVAGVSPVNFGRRGFDDINIRGFRSTESILVDGLVRNPGMWARLQPYGYDRIEVLKGSASVLYGQVQPGGLVNAVSKRPRNEAFNEVGLEVGSFGLRTLTADMNKPLSASGKTALRINTLVSQSDDPTRFVYSKDQWLAPSLSIDMGPRTDLVVFATYSHREWLRQQGITPYGTVLPNANGKLSTTLYTGEPSFGPYNITGGSLGYSLEHRLSASQTLRQNVRYESQSGTGNFVSNGTLQANGRLQNRMATRQYMDDSILATDTSLLTRFAALDMQHRLVTGLDLRTSEERLATRRCQIAALNLYNPVYGVQATCPANMSSDAPSKLTVAGLYAQDQIKFAPGWTALLGLRHDWSDNQTDDRLTGVTTTQKDKATTASSGVVYEFAKGWSTYASHGESFLPVSGLSFAGKPFAPETGHQWEGGLKYEAPNRRVTGSLAIYELTRQNVTTADLANVGFSVQTGEQRAKGLELEMGLDLPSSWKLTAAYTYTLSEVTHDNDASIVGKPLNLTPRHTATLWATYTLPQLPGVTVGLGGRYVSEQKGSYSFSLPSYFVADATISYTGDNYRLSAGVKNVFNKAYYDGAINANVVSPAAPRSVSIAATYYF